MSQEGYADPVMNDGPGFHSIIPVSELTERVTRARATEASDVSSAPPVARNHGRGNARNSTDPYKAQWGSRAQDTLTRPTPGSMSPSFPIPRLSLDCT